MTAIGESLPSVSPAERDAHWPLIRAGSRQRLPHVDQARPRRSGEPSIAIVPVPHAGAVGPDGSPDLRERIYRHAAGE